MSERVRTELEGSGSYHLDAAPVDLEAQRRELEEAGWMRIERLGKVVWRRPNSTYLSLRAWLYGWSGKLPKTSLQNQGKPSEPPAPADLCYSLML